MSTATQTTNTKTNNFWGSGKIRERPQLAVQFAITEVKPKQTSDESLYEMLDIFAKPLAGSQKLFPKLFFRREWFQPGFDSDSYLDYETNPDYGVIEEGYDKTIGQRLDDMYQRHMSPVVEYDGEGEPKRDKDTGLIRASKVTTMMAIAGGTVEAYYELGQAFAGASAQPGWEASPEQIATVINTYLKAMDEPPAQFGIARQARMNGELRNDYELSTYRGPVTIGTHNAILKQAEKNATGPIGRRVSIGYQTE